MRQERTWSADKIVKKQCMKIDQQTMEQSVDLAERVDLAENIEFAKLSI